LTIKNSSKNELNIRNYSKIDIEGKISMVENKNRKKVMPNEFISKIIEKSSHKNNRIYKITDKRTSFH